MPHSSGGGSGHHSGGGHSSSGSSYHSSRSGGSSGSGSGYRGDSAPHISRAYYPGARRYRYLRHGQYRYFYSMDSSFGPTPLKGLVYLPIIIAVFIMMIWPTLKGLKQYDREIRIIDRANVLENSSRLTAAMNAFSEKTKITPAVITLYNEEWRKYYGTLEDYAYSQYLLNFEDEKHWLIVYSEAQDKVGSWEWYWEGMQGDDTDPVLTKGVTELFNRTMQTGLVDEKSPVPDVIASAFDAVTDRAGTLRPRVDTKRLLIGGVVLLSLFISAFFSMNLHQMKYRHAEYDPDDFGNSPDDSYRVLPAYLSEPSAGAVQQPVRRNAEMDAIAAPQALNCRYCGSPYTAGTKYCPSCGAALPDSQPR